MSNQNQSANADARIEKLEADRDYLILALKIIATALKGPGIDPEDRSTKLALSTAEEALKKFEARHG